MTQTAEHRRLVRLAASYNTKARRLGVRGFVGAFDLMSIEYATPNCHYCGVGLEIGQGTFDHVVPLGQGGLNSSTNIVRCCLTCNRQKYTKSPEQLAEHEARIVTCSVCGKQFKPRWAEYQNGRARLCSRRCSALKRWQQV